MNNWFEIKAAIDSGTRAQVFIFGVIVDYKWDEEDVTAKEFIDALKPLGDFDLRINSPGGSVTAGNAIYNALRRHKGKIDVYVDGLAASMASVVAMAGHRVIMPANAMLMIHDPWSYAVGNSADMRKIAETLDKFKSGMVTAYMDKSGMDEAQVVRMMTDETWITAAEAVEMGFADEIEVPIPMAAQFDLSRYQKVPVALLPPPPVAAQKKGTPAMLTIEAMKKDHPELLAQIETAARVGMIATAEAATAQAQAVTAESTRVLALVSATLGAETGKKLETIVSANLSAEQVTALGLNIAPPVATAEGQTQAEMLAAITNVAPAGVKAVAGKTDTAAEERKSTVSAIAAGGSVK